MIKWNLINNEYYKGKLYCIYFKVTPTSNEYIIDIKNSKTKEELNSKKDYELEFKSLDEAYDWCEKYARVTYFDVYNQYKDWKDDKPSDKIEWENCKQRYDEWLPEFKINFKSIGFNIHDKDKIIMKKILNAYEQLLQTSFKRYDSYESEYLETLNKNLIKLMADELNRIEEYKTKIASIMSSFE